MCESPTTPDLNDNPHAPELALNHTLREGIPTSMQSRRQMLKRGLIGLVGFSGMSYLAGCHSSSRSRSDWPSPAWETASTRPVVPPASTAQAPAASLSGVISRQQWTSASPDFNDMNRMAPVRAITVHHDALVNFSTSQSSAAARLESIRRYHRESNRWADIGYHYAIDRGGRIWECRSTKWQGAHVKNHNEGNLGVMLLGNFDEQSPSRNQVASLRRHLQDLMRRYHVPAGNIYTHQEWNPTRCPGRALQDQMDSWRNTLAFS